MNKNKNRNGQELFPLRIDARTVIYVTEDKCNEVYAQRKRAKLGKVNTKASLSDIAF